MAVRHACVLHYHNETCSVTNALRVCVAALVDGTYKSVGVDIGYFCTPLVIKSAEFGADCMHKGSIGCVWQWSHGVVRDAFEFLQNVWQCNVLPTRTRGEVMTLRVEGCT